MISSCMYNCARIIIILFVIIVLHVLQYCIVGRLNSILSVFFGIHFIHVLPIIHVFLSSDRIVYAECAYGLGLTPEKLVA